MRDEYVMLLSEGQMSEHNDAALSLDGMSPAADPIADRSYDGNWLRHTLPPAVLARASLVA